MQDGLYWNVSLSDIRHGGYLDTRKPIHGQLYIISFLLDDDIHPSCPVLPGTPGTPGTWGA